MATPSLQLEFTIHILDLSTPEHRRTSKTLLDCQHKPTVHQLDRSDLSHEELLDILNAFDDENTFEELDLDSLETISGGLGLPEALISSTILMVMLSSASGLFADSMGELTTQKSKTLSMQASEPILSKYGMIWQGIYCKRQDNSTLRVSVEHLGKHSLIAITTQLQATTSSLLGVQM